MKQSGTLARNNGIKTVFTKCAADYCKWTVVKGFVHAQKNEAVKLCKIIFREEINFLHVEP